MYGDITIDQIITIISESSDAISALASIITAITGIASAGLSAFLALITLITTIIAFVVNTVIWVLEAIPVYSLAKKLGRKNAILAWIPIFGDDFRLWVIADMAGDKPATFYKEKWTIKNRNTSFWYCIALKYLGGILMTIILSVLSFIPIIGQLSWLFALIPGILVSVFEYVYLRDVLNLFKPNLDANKKTAFIVCLLDYLVAKGFARIICLYTLLKRKPLPIEEIVVEEAVEA